MLSLVIKTGQVEASKGLAVLKTEGLNHFQDEGTRSVDAKG
jgi:hypothetical protein